MSEERTYESAVDRLDQIISRLDSGEAQLRETLDLCAEAKTLIEYCAAELAAVDQGLKELNLDELARSLTTGGTGAGGIAGPAADMPPEPQAATDLPAELPAEPGDTAPGDDVPF